MDYELFTSQFVIDEALAGDAESSARRIAILDPIERLAIPTEAETLADSFLTAGALPSRARIDALHLAVATVNGIEFLLTWNCKHLANAMLWRKIEQTCSLAGYERPEICTPYGLFGDDL